MILKDLDILHFIFPFVSSKFYNKVCEFQLTLYFGIKHHSMDAVTEVLISLTTLIILWPLLSFLYSTWWKPIQTKQKMYSQGIHGPPYRFLHGNSKEVFHMNMEAMRKPLDHLSHRILPRVQPHLHAWIQLYGRCMLTWAGPIPEFYVAEIDLAKEILQNRDKAILKLKMEGFFKKLMGNGVSTSEGERWVRKRKLVNQAFSSQSLKNMVPVMADCVEVMLERWETLDHHKVEIEVSQEFRLLSSDVISRTAFGSNYEQGKDIFATINKLSLLIVQRTYSFWLPPFLRKLIKKSKQDVEADKLEQRLKASILQIIRNREEEKDDEHAMDLLSLLLRAMKCEDSSINGYKVSIEDIIDECKTFYFAGQDTTTSLLSWTVFLLAIHQEWQEKARNEVLMIFGNKEHPNADNLSKMKIMSMIINETLRLYPVSNELMKQIEKEVKLEKLILPAKSRVTIQVMAMHHDKDAWGEDVHMFKPERFEEGVPRGKEDGEVGFLPFGFGPRMCPGKNFALNETKIAIAMILQRYAFSLSPCYVHAPMRKMALCPQHGIPILLHPL